MKLHGVNIPEGKIADFCERHHIRKLALFGSILRERAARYGRQGHRRRDPR